jgi:hypothetical protein
VGRLRLLRHRLIAASLGLFPGEIVNGRAITASAIKRLFQWQGNAIVIDPDVIGKAVDAVNSVQTSPHVPSLAL